MSIPQQINFIENLEEDNGATIFFIAEKQQKTISYFSIDSLIATDVVQWCGGYHYCTTSFN